MRGAATSGGSGFSSWQDLAKRHEGRIAFALLFLITIPMLTKVFTSDYGTHIAMGRYTVQNLRLPTTEFLNYTALGSSNFSHEWGFQALLYLVFSLGGTYAVSFLCWGVVFGIFFLIHRASVIRGANPLLAVLAIFAFSGFLRIRIQPRPEIFTYLFVAATILLLTEYYFGKRRKALYLFPPLILVWCNFHGSYLIAFVLCGAFFVDALARSAWRREFRWDTIRNWVLPPLATGTAGLLLCGLNPYGYDALLAPLHLLSRGGGQSSVLMSISELTPLRQTGMFVYYKAAAGFALASFLLGTVGRRIYLLDLLLVGIAFKGGWDSARAVSMMGLFIAPATSLHITGFVQKTGDWIRSRGEKRSEIPARKEPRDRKRRRQEETARPVLQAEKAPRRHWGRAASVALLSFSMVSFGGITLSFSFSQLEHGIGLTEHKFSLKAAEFLRKNPISGNMFNFFDVGGFLDWQLYPQALTFIDGRAINQEIFREHQIVTSAMPGWQEVLNRHGVTYIVTKGIDSQGTILPLIGVLANDANWSLVFADGLFLVFARNIPENQEYIRKHGISKSMLPQHIIWESYHYTFLGISPVMAYYTMSNMYLTMGNRAAAIELLRNAVKETGDPFLRNRLIQMETGGSPR